MHHPAPQPAGEQLAADVQLLPLTFVTWQAHHQIQGLSRKGEIVIASSHLCGLVIVLDSSGNNHGLQGEH